MKCVLPTADRNTNHELIHCCWSMCCFSIDVWKSWSVGPKWKLPIRYWFCPTHYYEVTLKLIIVESSNVSIIQVPVPNHELIHCCFSIPVWKSWSVGPKCKLPTRCWFWWTYWKEKPSKIQLIHFSPCLWIQTGIILNQQHKCHTLVRVTPVVFGGTGVHPGGVTIPIWGTLKFW